MSSTSDKIKDYANEAAGKLKQGVGKAVRARNGATSWTDAGADKPGGF